eukprot:scaffold7340_cov266-Pinguiococcus_pyrenoidosus.AAC.87
MPKSSNSCQQACSLGAQRASVRLAKGPCDVPETGGHPTAAQEQDDMDMLRQKRQIHVEGPRARRVRVVPAALAEARGHVHLVAEAAVEGPHAV